jgi:uncharacterized repeat protein (TIGR03803 family)
MKAVFVTLLAGVLGSAMVQPVSAAEAPGSAEKVVWSFGGGTDGAAPDAALIDVNGMLYGTTTQGGGTGCGGPGCGTVFSIDPATGAETVVYAFCSRSNCRDGAFPEAALTDVSGTLYGTTEAGGTSTLCGDVDGCGAVFSLDPGTGAEKVLYSFCAYPTCVDGADPATGLVALKGRLYGTTLEGGSCADFGWCGTVFVVDPRKRAEEVLHAFCSQQGCADGAFPYAGLIAVNGTLYGTTVGGGVTACRYVSDGCGTVFSLDPGTGAETVLYTFCSDENCADGANPTDSVFSVDGMLYGTTHDGGDSGCDGTCGTVFALDPGTGTETVAYAFCQQQYCADGALPSANVIAVKGMLYGTTPYGGRTGCPQTGDCGTVFSLDPGTGAETVLYAFCSRKNCTDGWGPQAGLIHVKDTLYGTTPGGGANGYGTVFAIKTGDK